MDQRAGVCLELVKASQGGAGLALERRQDREALGQRVVGVGQRAEGRLRAGDRARQLLVALGQRVEDLAGVPHETAHRVLL